MKRVSSVEYQRNMGTYTDMALTGEAVLVTVHGRPRIVIVSAQEYEALVEARRQLGGNGAGAPQS